MPFCTEAITDSIPDSQKKPGKYGGAHSYQMKFSGFSENPSGNIEKGE